MAGPSYDWVKRLMDFVLASVALLASAPIQLALAILIRMSLGSPVFFRQLRPGKDEEIFQLVKFRTMLEPDPDTGLTTDAARMTRLGSFLRSTSLDELPSLWNVVKGDMSLVGPRPLLVKYLDRYSPEQRGRHAVRPGLTGLAQVRGRNFLTWEERFAYDLQYVRERSLALDARIVLLTVRNVILRHGITAQGEATMPEFMGYGEAA